MPTALIGIGIGIAYAIHNYGDTAKYEERLELTRQYDMVWAYMGAFLFLPLVNGMNMYPVATKARICRGGNIRANMYYYKLATAVEESSAVVLYDSGDLGLYNRANRGVHHFIENSIPVVLMAQFTVYAYTIPTFVLVAIYCAARIIYQIGYTHRGFGGHFPGFILERLSMCTLGGLLFVSAIKTYSN